MEKQHIFFDLDGTLTDSMPGITRGVQYALRHYGIIEEDLSRLKPFVGPPLPDSFREYYNFSEKDANEAVYVFREYYNVTGWKENAPYAGVPEMLYELKRAGKKLYVATSKPEETAKRVLEYFDMTDFFEFIGGAVDDGNRSRKAEVIRFVMEECGLSKKESIVMVGDRRHDMEGARAAGVEPVGILYGYGSREELIRAGAARICETVLELTAFLSYCSDRSAHLLR